MSERQTPLPSSVGERLARLEVAFEERHESNTHKLDKILEQTTKTNGSVSRLDERVDSLESTRDHIRGGWALAVILGGVIGFIVKTVLDIWKVSVGK